MASADKEMVVAGFVDVAVAGPGRVYLLAIIIDPENPDDEDALGSRLFCSRGDRWEYYDFPDLQLVRVAALPSPEPQAIALGSEGAVVVADDQGCRLEQLPRPVAEIGNMTSIRAVGRSVFACGLGGQVYRRSESLWTPFDEGLFQTAEGITTPEDLINFKPRYLADVDGRSEEDLYVVGISGLLYHYDGGRWQQMTSPTNYPLNAVVCDQTGVCLGAAKGRVFRLVGEAFQEFQLPVEDDVWGLATYEGKLYASTQNAVYVLVDDVFDELNTGFDPPLAPYRLEAGAGQLWSVSQVDVAYLENGVWKRPRLSATES